MSRRHPSSLPPASPGRRRVLWHGPALLLAAAQVPATAQEVLRYGGDADFPPFESLDAAGQPRGFQPELLAELGRELGVRFELALRPWHETEAAFRAGRIDLIAMVDTAPRREWALFARSHATPALALYHRGYRAAPQDLPDLAGRRVALPRGEPMRQTRSTFLSGIAAEFVERDGPADALAAVQRGEADFALLPRAYGDRALAAGAAPDVQAARLNLPLQPYAFAVAPGREALRDRLQRGLAALEADGRLEALRVRWLSSHRDEAERRTQRAWSWGIGIASAIAVAALGAAAWQRGRRIVRERERRREAESAL